MVKNETKAEAALREQLRTKLNAETGKLTWAELERHFARGAVIKVAGELDLVAVAEAVAEDHKDAVEDWMKRGVVAHPDVADARD